MRLDGGDAALGHLCYCSNIHPGESWDQTRSALGRYLPAVKARVSPDAPFGVGLRLSALAAQQLERQADLLAEFRQFLTRHGLYVFTINGFPYGRFHGAGVKQQVYQPDWRRTERLEYSNRLAVLLAGLMPPELSWGSVSTVPGAFAADARADADSARAILDNLLHHVAFLQRLHLESGRCIRLALEPEPACLLETSADAVAFFEDRLLSPVAMEQLGRLCRCPPRHAETLLRRHLGLCLDCCHAAVEFEDPDDSLNRLEAAGIDIVKLQLSAGLRLPAVGPEHRALLRDFAEDSYLHQVVQRGAGGLRRFDDLPAALDCLDEAAGAEWRIHFHVPLWAGQLGAMAGTGDFVAAVLARHRSRPISDHLEVETYSWSVLPAAYREAELADAIARELDWVKERLR
ncbi:metabolite traffic protein EboE [Chromobacterium sp. ATCC 53434]|uniref:metabolite traffic protein EboE n=1 Tax=Chromobacterium sp. (strain ATCC 53434 / SC 14030) TaxID=2059672 RepID=UPI0018F11940|nr:metabolite traffic protein EboE [Chromobacterium sp. ATCC 53434]